MDSAANHRAYTPFAKLLHWLIALLVAVQFVVAWFMPHIGRNTRAEGLVSLHFSLGVLIVLAMLARWVHRLRFPVPLEMPGAALAPPKAGWALEAGDVHGWSMWTLLALVALHALGALYHYFVRRDGVLQRMLPARSSA